MRDRALLTQRLTTPAAVAAILTLFRLFYGGLPLDGSRYLAVPIAIESGWPGTYPVGDILVQSGMSSGFHLYVLMGKLAATGVSLMLQWEAGLLITTFLLAWLSMLVAERITGRRDVALIAAVVLMTMPPYRGALAWAPFPPLEFVTGSLGACLLLAAVLLAWTDRWAWAGLSAGLLSNIHPSLGSIAFVMLIAVGVSRWHDARGAFLRALAIGVFFALPNVWAMARHLFGSGAGRVTQAGLLEMIAPFQMHYSLTRHVNHLLGFYTGALALAIAGLYATTARVRRDAIFLLAAVHALILLYILGVEILHSNFVTIFFWFRATSYVKVLAIPACTLLAVHAWREPGSVARRALLGILLLAAAFVQNDTVSAAFLMLALAWHLSQDPRWQGRTAAAVLAAWALAAMASVGWRRLGIPVAPREVQALLAVAGGVLPLVAIPMLVRARRPVPAAGEWMLRTSVSGRCVVGAVLVMVLSLAARHPYDLGWETLKPEPISRLLARVRIEAPVRELRGIVEWVGRATSRDALFVVPPDAPVWDTFRAASRRGVFVTFGDLAQLTYAPAAFLEARSRATLIGTRVIDGQSNASGYASLDDAAAAQLRAAGATHLVFAKPDAPRLAVSVVYEDTRWLVYSLTQGADALATGSRAARISEGRCCS